ncbi:MAG TPA: NADH-quinone oxidoreductase subunit N [Saprospiraceae bacterium]|nr:NADH-quinone oxidoreductase subunit N [Saprospiraceae bacterium]
MSALIILSLLGVVVLMMGLFHLKNRTLILIVPTLIGLIYLNTTEWGADQYHFSKMVFFDKYALGFSSLLIAITTLIFILCSQHYKASFKAIEDIYALLLFSLAGGICLVSYNNLIMLFLGIEILSIPLYILAGSNRDNYASNEASLKYFLMGAFASAIMLFGIAMIFGATNSFQLDEIKAVASYPKLPYAMYTGIFLTIAGFLFKISAAPFHFWAPDVYQGSPSLITSYMATVVKTAAFAAFFRFLYLGFHDLDGIWVNTLIVVTGLTLFVGNLSALYQTDFKRLMAFSGISHAGYLLLAVVALKNTSANALFFYATSYCLASITAFAIFLAIKEKTAEYSIESMRGLYKKNPLMAFGMLLAFLSLAGIPPLAGFFGKYFLFIEVFKANLIPLVLIAIVNTLIGAYYYLRVINTIFSGDPVGELSVKNSVLYNSVIVFAALGSLVLGLMPGLLNGIFN